MPREYALLAGFTFSIVLGTLLVCYALFSRRAQRRRAMTGRQSVRLKLLGVEIQSGAVFAIFAVGVALVVFPLKLSVDYLAAQSRPQPSPTAVPAPARFTEVAEAAEPVMDGFRILRDYRIIDLRSRIAVPDGKKGQKISEERWTRYTLLRKLSAAKEFVVFEFGTTGAGVSVRCLTHDLYGDPIKVRNHAHGSTRFSETWQIRIDVRNHRVNEDFLVINEATYWNGFTGEDREFAAMAVNERTDSIGMIVLFPPSKPFKSHALRFAPRHASSELKPLRDPVAIYGADNNQVLAWRVDKPVNGGVYQIEWTW